MDIEPSPVIAHNEILLSALAALAE